MCNLSYSLFTPGFTIVGFPLKYFFVSVDNEVSIPAFYSKSNNYSISKSSGGGAAIFFPTNIGTSSYTLTLFDDKTELLLFYEY